MHTLHGRRNTPRLIAILEQEYGLPIATLREIVAEHKTRLRAGNPVTIEEVKPWLRETRVRVDHPDWTEEQVQAKLLAGDDALAMVQSMLSGVAA
jgi:hypothetical protein